MKVFFTPVVFLDKHNARIWVTSNSHMALGVPLRIEKLKGCAMRKTKIIGTYFFGQQTVDKQASKSMLRYYGLIHVAHQRESAIFQQCGAPGHDSNAARKHLSYKLRSQWIIKRGPTNWPARSPDLTLLDFFL